jgi:hypothetical protein
MDDLIALSKASGLDIPLILRAYRGGLEPVIFGFAVFMDFKIAPGLVDLSLLQRWVRDGTLSEDEIDVTIAELVKDQIEEHLSAVLGIVGYNPPNRSGRTGFDES